MNSWRQGAGGSEKQQETAKYTEHAARNSLHFMLGELYKLLPLGKPKKKIIGYMNEGFKSAGMVSFLVSDNRAFTDRHCADT